MPPTNIEGGIKMSWLELGENSLLYEDVVTDYSDRRTWKMENLWRNSR